MIPMRPTSIGRPVPKAASLTASMTSSASRPVTPAMNCGEKRSSSADRPSRAASVIASVVTRRQSSSVRTRAVAFSIFARYGSSPSSRSAATSAVRHCSGEPVDAGPGGELDGGRGTDASFKVTMQVNQGGHEHSCHKAGHNRAVARRALVHPPKPAYMLTPCVINASRYHRGCCDPSRTERPRPSGTDSDRGD